MKSDAHQLPQPSACSGAWSPRRWPCKGRQTHAGKACWQRARDSRYFNILQDGRGACHVEERYASCAPSGVWAGRPVRQAGKGRFMVLKARSSPSMPHHGRISKWEGPGGAGFGGFYLYLGNTTLYESSCVPCDLHAAITRGYVNSYHPRTNNLYMLFMWHTGVQQLVQEVTGVLTDTKHDTVADVQESTELVLGSLKRLSVSVGALKQKLRNAQGSEFYRYHAARSIALIVGEMEAKFKACKTCNEYETLTKDSLEVLPAIADVMYTIKDTNPSAEQVDSILVKNAQLVKITRATEFFDAIRRDVKSVDRKIMGEIFPELSDYIDAKPDEEFRIEKSQA